MALSLLLSSCAATPHRIPSVQKPTPVLHDSPARDAQVRLLQEAHRAFSQERYRAAVLFFRRFAEDAPDSPRLAEARWWLGRAYEQIGDYRAAMEQYRIMAATMKAQRHDGTSFEDAARARLDELHQVSPEQWSGRSRPLAVRLRLNQLPPLSALSPWLEDLVHAGVTVLVVDLEPVSVSDRMGISMETIRGGVEEAHRHGLLYWIRVDLHRGAGREVRPEWMVRRCRGLMENGRGDASFDVTNPAYQASVEETVQMLSSSGIDGLVLAARSTDGFADECSEVSLQEYARSFGGQLTSESLSGMAVVPGDSSPERPVPYWRWAGWKVRNYVQWATRLRKVMRAVRPSATLLAEIHPTTVVAPLQGFEQFGEDVAELVAHTGGWILVRDVEEVGGQVLDTLQRQIGTSGQVWVERTVKASQVRPVVTALHDVMAGANSAQWNVLIRIESGGDLP